MKKIKECIECKEEKIYHAKGMCKKCYDRKYKQKNKDEINRKRRIYCKRPEVKKRNKEKRHDKCRCGNTKVIVSKQCRECYIKRTKGGLSRSMKFDEEKGEWISKKE